MIKNFIINLIFVIYLFSTAVFAEDNMDQWQNSKKTYKDLIDEGFEVKAYDFDTLKLDNGYFLMLFVTVLQKGKEVYECQEYQTLDENLQTLDLSLVCRQNVQPYQQGVGI